MILEFTSLLSSLLFSSFRFSISLYPLPSILSSLSITVRSYYYHTANRKRYIYVMMTPIYSGIKRTLRLQTDSKVREIDTI